MQASVYIPHSGEAGFSQSLFQLVPMHRKCNRKRRQSQPPAQRVITGYEQQGIYLNLREPANKVFVACSLVSFY